MAASANSPRRFDGSSFLFVPAHDERKIEKALASGCDAIILDLEDGVPQERKAEGRDVVARYSRSDRLRHAAAEVWVRVNDAACPHFALDVRAVHWPGVVGGIVPKAEDPAGIRTLDEAGVGRMILLIESAVGLEALPRLAAESATVERVAIGTWDLALDLGLVGVDDPDESELIWQLRGQLVVDSRRLRLNSPIDGIYARFDDDAGLRARALRAFRMGYSGKLLIHPRQIPIARAIFTPNEASVQFARDVVAAYERALGEGSGVAEVGGVAIDRPTFERARAVLTRAGTAQARTDTGNSP